MPETKTEAAILALVTVGMLAALGDLLLVTVIAAGAALVLLVKAGETL